LNGNVEDCAGTCNGDVWEDDCGLCNGTDYFTYNDGTTPCTQGEENCLLPDGTCDCDGNVEDCFGQCGGPAMEDECGVCGGSGNCDGIPEEFFFNQSAYQAFYYPGNIEDIYGYAIESDDWLAAFTSDGNTCVGSRQWDSSQCNNGVCDLMVMGDDGYPYSDGYLEDGEEPVFKIYDMSKQEYFHDPLI
jgi:hypothetical protein